MVRYFADNPTNARRAQQIWLILIAAAAGRQIVTYGQLAAVIGIKGSQPVINPLYHIKYWCEENELPPLTVIVVNKKAGKPGSGMGLDDVDTAQQEVFQYPWYRVVPPTVEELDVVYKAKHHRS